MSQPNPEAAKQQQQLEQEDFSWLSPPPPLESTQDKFLRKFKENPAVPLGCAATVGALTFGLVQFKRGNMARSQLAMRLRVVAQGGTIIALVAGVLYSSIGSSKKSQSRTN